MMWLVSGAVAKPHDLLARTESVVHKPGTFIVILHLSLLLHLLLYLLLHLLQLLGHLLLQLLQLLLHLLYLLLQLLHLLLYLLHLLLHLLQPWQNMRWHLRLHCRLPLW
jgi:hypothetical protein